jgi:hypothetical protein
VTLASLLLAHDGIATAGIRAWLLAARRYALTAADLARIDLYGSTDGATLHAQLPLVLPLEAPIWYEVQVVAAGGTAMVLGYGATPGGPGEIGIWFAATAISTGRVVGPLGPLRLDATAIDSVADIDAPSVRELRAAAGIVIRALLLGLGTNIRSTP